MTHEEMLKKAQAIADEGAKNFVFHRSAHLDEVYVEEREDGTADLYALSTDMPKLIYRVFTFDAEGNGKEITDIATLVEKTKHYNTEIKPTLKLVPPFVEETGEYEIVLESSLPDNGVEIKLKSSTGRDVTMIETYRYYDYVSRIFFVSCVCLSFGGQYLFSVTSDGKHLRLIVGNDPAIRARVDMMTELLAHHLLPSYKTIDAGNKALMGQEVRGKVTFKQADGSEVNFLSQFCYDDLESGNMFAFFVKEDDEKNGLMFIQDIGTQKLTLSNTWTEEQKAAADKVQALLANNREEFNKHVHSFFADSLDLRFNAYKNGTLTASEAPKAE